MVEGTKTLWHRVRDGSTEIIDQVMQLHLHGCAYDWRSSELSDRRARQVETQWWRARGHLPSPKA